MSLRKKKRKTRITKQDISEARKDIKMSSYQRKRRVVPGPWTEMETKLKIEAAMKLNNNSIMASSMGPSFGSYTNKDEIWGEKGWYPIVFNLVAPDMKETITESGLDQFLAASEKSLNEQRDATGRPKYGVVIFTRIGVDGSQREDEERRFVSIRAKTNKKNISGFRATRKKKYVTLP